MRGEDFGVNPHSGVTLAAGSLNVILMRRRIKCIQIDVIQFMINMWSNKIYFKFIKVVSTTPTC